MLGNKESFGFRMEPGEAQKLDEFVAVTAFIMRVFIFILLGAQVDFALMSQYWIGGAAVVAVLMLLARPATGFLCAGPDRRAPRGLEFCRVGVHVLDPRTRRHTGGACRAFARNESAWRAGDRFGHLCCHFDDDSNSGADDKMAGRPPRAP